MQDGEDILDLIDSGEKPFNGNDEKPEQKKQWTNDYKKEWKPNSEWKPRGDWKPKGNGYNYGKKPAFENLWDKKDFVPKKIELKELIRNKAFLIVTPRGTEIGEDVKKVIINIAAKLGAAGYTFRTTADKLDIVQKAVIAKYLEARGDNDNKGYPIEEYLPWPKFNEDIEKPTLGRPNINGYSIAVKYHTSFYEQKEGLRAIFARDAHLCLGASGVDAVKFMVIYTPCGSESLGAKPDYRKLGNATFYLKIAEAGNIPVFNVKNMESIKRLGEFLKNEELKKELENDDPVESAEESDDF